jgi:nucleoside-diphosphate-sugar epimerase
MSKQLILITGASGFLGFHVLVTALKSGYRARVALRKLEQAHRIKSTKSIQSYQSDVEFVAVPDITASNAYDEAVKGVDLVIHCASPLSPDPTGVSLVDCSFWAVLIFGYSLPGKVYTSQRSRVL